MQTFKESPWKTTRSRIHIARHYLVFEWFTLKIAASLSSSGRQIAHIRHFLNISKHFNRKILPLFLIYWSNLICFLQFHWIMILIVNAIIAIIAIIIEQTLVDIRIVAIIVMLLSARPTNSSAPMASV